MHNGTLDIVNQRASDGLPSLWMDRLWEHMLKIAYYYLFLHATGKRIVKATNSRKIWFL